MICTSQQDHGYKDIEPKRNKVIQFSMSPTLSNRFANHLIAKYNICAAFIIYISDSKPKPQKKAGKAF